MKETIFYGVISTLLLVFITSCCTTQSNLVSRDPEMPLYKRAVKVQARHVDADLAIVASGFALDNETIITAGHFCLSAYEGQVMEVVQEDIELVFVNNNGELGVITGGRIDAINEKMDICAIKRPKHGIVPLPMSKKETKIYDHISVVGGPLGFFPVVSEGRVISPNSKNLPTEDLNNRLIINAIGTFGNSGGPVINDDKEVVGIVMAKITDFLLVVVRSETIFKFLAEEYGE